MSNFKNLADFISFFPNEKACRAHFERIRFSDGDFCPHCGHKKINRFADGLRYRCASCKLDFTIKTGTIFGESKLPLRKWFIAIYLLTTSKKGISSIELAEQVGVTQKTAWFMDMRIRSAMKDNGGKLFGSGIVEVDETYLGGKHVRKDGFRKKHAVMGMTERGGKIRAFSIPHRGTEVLLPTISKNVSKKAFIMSDEASVYRKLPKIGYQWGAVKHGKKHWAHGNINTNSIESFWALFKRGYHGTYHSMSKKHMQRYVDEFSYRFNLRGNDLETLFNAVTLSIAGSGKLSYKKLTA
jgi:transposase-like protein